MRVLHLSNHRKQYNGMVTVAIDLACAQADLGHHVAICSGPGDFNYILTEHKVSIFDLRRVVTAKTIFGSMLGILKAIRQFEPDVIHAHMIKVTLLTWLIAKLMRIPLVTSVQNSFSKYSFLMRIGDRVITASQAVADDMATRGIPPGRLRSILNGTIGSARQSVQSEQMGMKRDNHIAIKRPAVITACGLHPRKGVPDLIDGFKIAQAELPSLNLYIFGGGPNEDEYKTRAFKDGPSNIAFCGQVPDVLPFFKAADVFVLASLADPAPLVVSEAREARLAIIATNVDGIPELLEHGEAGILVEPKSPAAIAEQLLLLFKDPDRLNLWKEKSQFCIDRLSVFRVADETI